MTLLAQAISLAWLDATSPAPLGLSGTALAFNTEDTPLCRFTVNPGGAELTVVASLAPDSFSDAMCAAVPGPLAEGATLTLAYAPNGRDFVDTGFEVRPPFRAVRLGHCQEPSQ